MNNQLYTSILNQRLEQSIRSDAHRDIIVSPGQLIFGRDTILPIKQTVDLESILQRKQTQINKYSFLKNSHRVDHDYELGDKVIITKNTAYKYKTQYTRQFDIAQCCTNVTVKLQNGVTKITYNIIRIKPYKSDTKVEDSSSKNMYDNVNI